MNTNQAHDIHFSNENQNQRSPGSQRQPSHSQHQSTSPTGFEGYQNMSQMMNPPPGSGMGSGLAPPPGYGNMGNSTAGSTRGYGPLSGNRPGAPAGFGGYDHTTWTSPTGQNPPSGLRTGLLNNTLQGHMPNLSATERPRGQATPGGSARAPLPAVSVFDISLNDAHETQNWLQDPSRYAGMPGSNGIMANDPNLEMALRRDLGRDDDDDLIPTAIVIKNIPFAVKKEQLVTLMTDMGLPIPYAFNYHFDNGVFRGLAFANFTSADETQLVINALNHYELAGRKLRVEYKKMLPLQERERIEREKRIKRGQLEEQHRPLGPGGQLQNQASLSSLASQQLARNTPSPVASQHNNAMVANLDVEYQRSAAMTSQIGVDFNDPMNLCLYTELLFFKRDTTKDMLILPPSLSPIQRRVAHTIAHSLHLAHVSKGMGDDRAVHIYRSAEASISPPLTDMNNANDAHRRALNRAATTDFSDVRDSMTNPLMPRSSGFLGIPDSPGGILNSNLRAAKSFHDLRAWTPSPNQGPAARFPEALMNGTTASNPNLTSTLNMLSSNNRDSDNNLANGFASLALGNSPFAQGSSGSPLGTGGPRTPWENPSGQTQTPQPAPIGSNRTFSTANVAATSSTPAL